MRISNRAYIGVGLMFFLLCIGLIPVSLLRAQNTPKEDAKYIRRIYADHTVGQVFRHGYYSIRTLAVLVRSDVPHSETIIVRDAKRQELARKVVVLTLEDRWVQFSLTKALPKGIDTITLSTLSEVNSKNAILMRYQADSNLYAEGNMVVDGKDSYGDIAFRITETLPLWRAALVWGQVNSTSVYAAMRLVASGALATVLLYALSRISFQKYTHARMWAVSGVLFIGFIGMCAPYAHLLNGVFGGDAFNYMFKAYALMNGHDPFAADPRKGPFFSLLLIPGLFLPDPLMWSRWVGIVAAGLVVGLVPFVARRMGISYPISIMAGIFTAENSFLLFEAPDALAVTTFTFLILLCVYAFLSIKKNKTWLWVLAITSGLTMLTRFEGALVGAVLLPAAWIRYRISWKKILWPVVLMGVIMALPLVSFIWSGKSGIRTTQDIQNDGGLFLVHSIHDQQLSLNIQRSYEFFTNVWIEKGTNMNIAQWLLCGLIIGGCIVLGKQFWPKVTSQILAVIGIIGSLGFVFLLAMNNEINRAILVAALYILVGAGIVLFSRKKPIDGIAIILAIASQIAVIIWVLPKTRYFLPTIPFLYVFLAYGIQSLIPAKKNIAQGIAVVMMCVAAIFFFQDTAKHSGKTIEAYNNNAQENDVLLKALIDLRSSGKSVGIESLDDLSVIIYIPKHLLYTLSSHSNADQELQFIQSNHIQVLLKRAESHDWSVVTEHPELFNDPKIYTTKNGDSKVLVYSVK